MDLALLTEQSLALHQRFSEAARRKGGRAWTREEIMQGFVVDTGDLMKLVMAANGLREIRDRQDKLAHELADCLWSVLVLARLYDVDLERAFTRMVDETTRKLAADGGQPAADYGS